MFDYVFLSICQKACPLSLKLNNILPTNYWPKDAEHNNMENKTIKPTGQIDIQAERQTDRDREKETERTEPTVERGIDKTKRMGE